jgi:hypothetical protein
MSALGSAVKSTANVYVVGGATAVLLDWRSSTIDVDLKLVPESDELLKSLPGLKERLEMNIELASPDHFIPALPGWEQRSLYIQRHGNLSFFHYDFYAQALAKIERGHANDLVDVREMSNRRLIKPARLLDLFSAIEGAFYRYPAIDPSSFRQSVERTVAELSRPGD